MILFLLRKENTLYLKQILARLFARKINKNVSKRKIFLPLGFPWTKTEGQVNSQSLYLLFDVSKIEREGGWTLNNNSYSDGKLIWPIVCNLRGKYHKKILREDNYFLYHPFLLQPTNWSLFRCFNFNLCQTFCTVTQPTCDILNVTCQNYNK